MNDFEKKLKEALKKNLRVEVELVDSYGYDGDHWQDNITRVYFGDELIFSTNYKEKQRIHEYAEDETEHK